MALSVDEGKNLWQELDPHDTGVSSREALRAALLHAPGHTASAEALAGSPLWDPARLALAAAAWDLVSAVLWQRRRHGGAGGGVTVDELVGLFRGEAHPGVRARLVPTAAAAATRLRDAFECYVLPELQLQTSPGAGPAASAAAAAAAAVVTRDAWMWYYAHVSAAADSDAEFAQALCGPWQLAEGLRSGVLLPHGSPAVEAACALLRASAAGRPALPSSPPSHLAVLVTHAGGRRSVERVAADAFLIDASSPGAGVPSESVLLARLAAAGVRDAVAASLDF